MTRMFHLVLVIILTYVCVLNVMIVHVMYNRFLKHRIAPLPVPAPRIPLHLTPPPQRQRVKMTAACERRHREIVVWTSPMTNGNDALVHATALPQLRQALRVTSDMIDTHVLLVATTNTFLNSHRSWCSALFMQTRQRVSCDLMLLPKEPSTGEILQQVRQQAPCVDDVILLPDTVHLTPNFLIRLSKVSKIKVTCLVEDYPMTSPRPACTVPAYRLPRLFIDHYLEMMDKQQDDISVEKAARELHLYAGNAAVVGLG